ncbi:hypothetical protein CONLIGDRAFT_627675, partial [Coniochaeta ligniaria NRRL 30616]
MLKVHLTGMYGLLLSSLPYALLRKRRPGLCTFWLQSRCLNFHFHLRLTLCNPFGGVKKSGGTLRYFVPSSQSAMMSAFLSQHETTGSQLQPPSCRQFITQCSFYWFWRH